MITASSGFLGISLNSYMKKQILYLDMLIIICKKISIMLEHSMPDTEEIISSLKQDSSLKSFDFTLNSILVQDKILIGKIKHFFDSIGRFDAQTQINLANSLSSECALLKEKYQQEYDKHYRLYLSFGILSGLMFSLIII